MDPDLERVVREELWRSVVWFALGLFGWATIINGSDAIEATAVTALGLPLLTWAALTGVMVGLRRLTGWELKVTDEGGQLLLLVTSAFVVGFVVLYEILVTGRPVTLAGWYVLAVAGGVVVWRRNVQRQARH
ncbi:hypothetical protein ACFQH6_05575 [Halobacteriaceae archaeon GCM10025711]